jgi:hypothetical protein
VSTRSRGAIVALVVATAALLLGACGSDTGSSSTTTPTTQPGPADGLPAFDARQQLPPNDVGSLRALYDPALAKLGVRLTRAELIDVTNSLYEPSNDGRHLAMYVEPIADYSSDQYVNGFWTVSALITPDVFARWPELESYDLCQEPLPAVDDSPEPFPVTQINISRAAAESIDWKDGDLVDLLTVARTNPDLRIIVNRQIRETPAYAAADAAAKTKAGLDPAPVPTTAATL